MQCYYCGSDFPPQAKLCPNCGRAKSNLIYVHLCGVIGGLLGSWIGFTAYDVAGALAGGLIGIVACEIGARWIFHS